MMISTKGRYALRAMIDLAENGDEEHYVPLSEIARRQGISEKYLEAIIATLSRGGLVIGVRGKGGGYRLAHEPKDYVVADVLRLTEGTLAPVACLDCEADAITCERKDTCRTLPLWKGLDDVVSTYLSSVTLADLMVEGEEILD